MKKLLMFTCIFAFISCVQSEVQSELDSGEDYIHAQVIRLEEIATELDSLTLLSKIQSDHDVLMMNSITYSNDQYSLNLSIDDALKMGIPEMTYKKYSDYISRLND